MNRRKRNDEPPLGRRSADGAALMSATQASASLRARVCGRAAILTGFLGACLVLSVGAMTQTGSLARAAAWQVRHWGGDTVFGSVLHRRAPTRLVLWAWERPEDLRFAGDDVSVAVLAGTVLLSGEDAVVRPRLQPARVSPGQTVIGTVHVEIDRRRPLAWTTAQRGTVAAAILSLTGNPRFAELQVDFEVRASERGVLLDVLRDVRAGLPPGRALSMTALASWCDTERWLGAAPVDDVVPMLFRMGQGGAVLQQRLAAGGGFGDAHCGRSLGVAVDTPPMGLPSGRRIFLFDPAPWTQGDLAAIRRSL